MELSEDSRQIVWTTMLNLAGGEGATVLEQLGYYSDSTEQADRLYQLLSGEKE